MGYKTVDEYINTMKDAIDTLQREIKILENNKESIGDLVRLASMETLVKKLKKDFDYYKMFLKDGE